MNQQRASIFMILKNCLASFNALIEQGHSIIVIEHNTDVIKSADWVIDLGPEAGDEGGNLVYAGVPVRFEKNKRKLYREIYMSALIVSFYLSRLLSLISFESL